ncbi:SIR2 family protein [Microbacterium sp. BG28]|uniref:SIR2 family protein n=1 Tax=Microbacterium sp. BG28 TaxID=3097356 RepID=UPI002A5A0257|nr:SIR2 family protein [Microbacterium sp. BG28]MDY0828716.1 SIR2 family protein [Microbacterium sp. BG28]
MWITGEVELPDEILDAHERGELVFFVGAGASLGKPSNLPLFDGLAKKLARLASHPFSKRGGLDFFIGQLESLPQGFDAHAHAHALISDPKSRFNPLHSAIVDLAGIGRAFRVVTTNYDDHLASAASGGSITAPDTWYAPALPLGRDFAGLVHLHGSVRRPKEEMILTDRDFGHAYITDAWAARFLLPMFDRFTVVFIGYSHDDVIMRYLALGLPSSGKATASKRFAITSDPTNSKWGYLGIQPIAYPVVGRDHQALVAALTAWADRSKMGQTDHRSRVQAIIGGGTTLPLPDRDYLHARLRIADGARDFAMATESLSDEAKLEWLTWLEDFPEFKALFSPPDVPDATAILGNWFARTFIESTTLNGAALQTMQRLGQSATPSLYRTAIWVATDLSKQDAAAGERWQALLATSIYGQSAPLGTDFLMPFLPDSAAPSIAVLRAALRPFLKLERRWFLDDSAKRTIRPDAKVTWNQEEYALTQHVLLVVQESDAGDRSLGGALEDAIVAAYDLLDVYHGERGWDPLAHHRSAIEPHAQDEFREPLDAVIDGLREYGIKALPVWPDLPDRWWSLGRALMQRLALHLMAVDPARAADDKLSWLLDRTGLYADDLKHETYQILAAAVGRAAPSLKQRVLDAAAAGPDYPEEIRGRDRHFAYAKYNLLAWLTKAAPDWAEAQTAFDAAQSENPDFAAREHPDFDGWMTSGSWGGTPPMDIEEFVQALDQNVSAALDDLLSHDFSERHFDQPDWQDALRLVQQAAERRPDLGIQLWDAVLGRNDLDERQIGLWRAIAEGWGKADLGGSGLGAVQRLTALLPDKDSAYAIGRFLLDQIRQQIDENESPVIASMRELARSLWREQGTGFTHREDSTPLSFAPLYLNSWPGFVAQYWNSEVDRRWRHSREEWLGLSDEESEALVALLNGNKDALDATQPAIAGELFFHFAADADFAAAHLLPLFDDPQRHAFGWNPFLHHPRWNDRILAAGLFDSIVAELGRLDQLPERTLHHVFLRFVTSVVSYAGVTSTDRRRLLDQTVLASNGSHAVGFADAVARFLREDGVDGAEVWRRWLGRHLERRLRGQPRLASNEELARWADVVPAVGEFIPSAAMLFSGQRIGLGPRFLNQEFPKGVFVTYGDSLVTFFADRVRSTTNSDLMVRYRVQKLVQTVQAAAGESVATPLVEAAIEMGFLDAAD